MINLFKKKKASLHAPVSLQRKEVLDYNWLIAPLMWKGEDCDTLSGAVGPFGSQTNPIPVNGAIGELIYLGKLRTQRGLPLFFHQSGSYSCPLCTHQINGYEVMGVDGTHHQTLFLDPYHPRRSNLTPQNFLLEPFNVLKGEEPCQFLGVLHYVPNFPFGLTEALRPYHDKSVIKKVESWLELLR